MDYADSPTPPLTTSVALSQQKPQPPPPQTASAFGQQQLPATNSAGLKVSLPPETISQSSTAAQHHPFPPDDAFQMQQQQQNIVVDPNSSEAASNTSQSNKKDYYGAIPELERSPRRIGTNSSGTPYHHQEGSATLGVPSSAPAGPQPQSRMGGTAQQHPPDLPPKVPERSDRSSPPPLPPKKPHQQPSWPRYAHY